MYYRPGKEDHGLPRNPFNALITPRPIAWVSTVDEAGRPNLAPFSFFAGAGYEPPIVSVAFTGAKLGDHTGERKDSLSNIRATGEFTVSLVTEALTHAMNATAAHLAAGESEWEAAGVTAAPCNEVAPPRVAESPASLECRVVHIAELPCDAVGENTTVFGQVVGVHIDDACLRDGFLDPTLYKPLARMGYLDYTVVRDVFTLKRPE